MTGSAKHGADSPGPHNRVACVLLHAPATPIPTELLAALSKRIRRISTFSDAYLALAEACALAHSSPIVVVLVDPPTLPDASKLVHLLRLHIPAATTWYYSHHDGRTLRKLAPSDPIPWSASKIIAPSHPAPGATPAAGPRLASTLGPETPRLKPGGAPAFRPAAKSAKPANDPPRVVVRPGGGIGIRRLRLVGDDLPIKPAPPANGAAPNAGSAPESPAAEPSPPAPLLTEEELRMLLSDEDPGTADGGKERSTR